MGARIKCNKCMDIIESKSVHDFRRCGCGAIFIDGGDEYMRFGGELEDILREDGCEWVPVREYYPHLNVYNEEVVPNDSG